MMSERLVLALDGATARCSTALLMAGEGSAGGQSRVVASRGYSNGRGQARVVLRLVEETLEEVGAAPADLDSITVGTGPGTFTGVRIAVATARGLALALEIPVYGVSTLRALAACAVDTAIAQDLAEWSRIVPVIDARREQVFYAVYDRVSGPNTASGSTWCSQRPIAVCDRGLLGKALGGSREGEIVVVGEDQRLVGALPEHMRFLRQEVRAEYLLLGERSLRDVVAEAESEPGAESEARVAPGEPESVRPIYVRAPDADVHITKMKDPWADGGGRG